MQTDSLSPKGLPQPTLQTVMLFYRLDKNKLKPLKPPDTKAAPSTLGFKALGRCAYPPILPQDVFPASHNAYRVWVSVAPVFALPLGLLPWALASVTFSSFPDNELLVPLAQPPSNSAGKFTITDEAHSKETQPWV